MKCHTEVEADKKTSAVRFLMDGRNAGVLTFKNAEWLALSLVLPMAFTVTTETVTDDHEM